MQTEINREQVEELWAKAKAGDADSEFRLGNSYASGEGLSKDEVEAVKWYRKAAEQNYAPAQNNLGWCYAHGYGVAKDYAEAVKWYRKAAEQNDAMAQNNLGARYYKGLGVPKDYTEALKWYRKAAEQNYAMAQYNLGVCYESGHGVAKDYAEAVKWYRKAAEQNCAPAQYNLGVCYTNSQGVAKDDTEAVKWYRKAAGQNCAPAQHNLGNSYANGQGVAKDEVEAVKWYRKAAEQNDAPAQNNLGWCYKIGQGVAKDYAEAVKWFRKAAEQNFAVAQTNLADSYVNGLGVGKDYVEGYKWILLAGAQGDGNVKKSIAVVESRLTREQIAEGQRLARNFKPREVPSTEDDISDAATRPESSGSEQPNRTYEEAVKAENEQFMKYRGQAHPELYPVLMKDPAKPNGMWPDEWMHTRELLNTLETLDHWLYAETTEAAELAEQHLISTQEKIAKASEIIAMLNGAYFQDEPSCPIELQTAIQTDREWSKMLEAGTEAAFPQLDFLQLSKIGGVFDLRANVESLLLLEYLRHVCKSRRRFQAAQDTGRQELSPKESAAGEDIYDVLIIGSNADNLSDAITSAAKGLKTMLIEQSH